jgi:hypothetical protein
VGIPQLAGFRRVENREPDGLRAPEVDEGVHRGADRPAGEQHVVDQQDAAAVDRERDVGALHLGVLQAAVKIVAVERDVDDAEGDLRPVLDVLDRLAQALRQVDAARADADQRQLLGALVALEDLVRDAHHRALDRGRVHHLPGGRHGQPGIRRRAWVVGRFI